MIASEKDVVVQLQARLAQKLGAARFDLWFAQRTQFCPTDDGLTIAVEDTFYRDLLRRNFRQELESFCHDQFGAASTVRFTVEPELIAALNATSTEETPSASTPQSNEDLTSTAQSERKEEISGPRLAVVSPEPAKASVAASNTKTNGAQSTHHLPEAKSGRRRFAKLSEVVEGESNRLALSTARNVAEHPGSFTPLVIHGPAGAGKTQLLEGIWCAAREQARGVHAVYLTAEQFTTLFLGALRGNGLPAFRQKYRGVDLLLIDDVQFLDGKKATLGEFQYTIDTLVGSGKQIVLAADREVGELGMLGREVISRLQAGVSCAVELPDEGMRAKILMQQAMRQQMIVPEEVIALIAKRVHGSARELNGALNRLRAASFATGQAISEALARQTLVELFRSCKPVVRIREVEQAVCDVFGIPEQDLKSDRKSKSLTGPRMLAMFLARKHTSAAYSEIGRHFGNRSHSTVMSAKKRIESWVRDGGQVHLYGRPCEVTYALRQVESRIRVG